MKNHEEMFRALLEGKTLVDHTIKYKLIDGILHSSNIRKIEGIWAPLKGAPQYEYLDIMVETIDINGIEVPEPLQTAPEIGSTYWVVEFYRGASNLIDCYTWDNDRGDRRLLSLGLVHTTEEAAELHAKALLSFTKREPNE